MKKYIIPLLVLGIFSCTNNAPVKNSNLLTSTNNVENLKVAKTKAEVKFSFSIKDAASASRVKSVDVYLLDSAVVSGGLVNFTDPSVYIRKNQVDVVDGVISTTFDISGLPDGTDYYACIQAFDQVVSPTPDPSSSITPSRNNITAINLSASSLPVDVSTNTASLSGSGSTLTYSTGTALNVVIHLKPYNNANSEVTIQDGSETPTNPIVPTEVSPTPSLPG